MCAVRPRTSCVLTLRNKFVCVYRSRACFPSKFSTHIRSTFQKSARYPSRLYSFSFAFSFLFFSPVLHMGDASKVLALPKLTGNINHVTIANCKRLHIRNGTFSGADLIHRVTLEDIGDLTMESLALEFPPRMAAPKINVKFYRVSDFR